MRLLRRTRNTQGAGGRGPRRTSISTSYKFKYRVLHSVGREDLMSDMERGKEGKGEGGKEERGTSLQRANLQRVSWEREAERREGRDGRQGQEAKHRDEEKAGGPNSGSSRSGLAGCSFPISWPGSWCLVTLGVCWMNQFPGRGGCALFSLLCSLCQYYALEISRTQAHHHSPVQAR